jgi:glycosyltransferase involved in cell wall biosynthesis
MAPQVSVIMPVRNAGAWVKEAIESLLVQTFADFELLVIDDGSSDATRSILDTTAATDRRIRLIRTVPLGLVPALNRGLAETRGALLARLDADDRALPRRLGAQVDYMSRHPDVGLLGTWAERIDAQGAVSGRIAPETRSGELARILQSKNPFIHSTIMVRAELARQLAGYRPAFEGAEDYDFWLRIADISKVANLPEFLAQYRRHPLSMSNRQAIRQAFSVRLAQRSAQWRNQGRLDPADKLDAPADWRTASADSFFADIAVLYRLLDFADPSRVRPTEDLTPLVKRFGELNHDERVLASHAIRNFCMAGGPTSIGRAGRLMSVLSKLAPRHALKIGWHCLAGGREA